MRSQRTPHRGTDEFGETSNVDVLRNLLRTEVAAVEAYDGAIGRSPDAPGMAVLERLREGHSEAAIVWRERVRHFGGDAESDSERCEPDGPRPTDLMNRLREREENGIGQYESALADPDLDTDCQNLIGYRLLPRCQNNIRELGRLWAAADSGRDPRPVQSGSSGPVRHFSPNDSGPETNNPVNGIPGRLNPSNLA